jgi:arsenate reductase
MAEGLLRAMALGQFEVFSVGTMATHVRPEAVRVMKEIGIDERGLSSLPGIGRAPALEHR